MNRYYNNLGNYFAVKPLYFDESVSQKPNIRKLVEQPWQQTRAELWNEVTETLCKLEFIQAKAAAKMTYELVDDFNLLLQTMPDNAEKIRKELIRQTRLDKYAKDLILYARSEIKKLEVPRSIKPWTEQQIDTEIERIKNKQTRLERINAFYQFLGKEAGILQEHSWDLPELATQQAWNNYDSGPVGNAASKISSEVLAKLFLRTSITREKWVPLPAAINTYRKHSEAVNTIAITPDERLAVSGSSDNTCILWDLRTGRSLLSLSGHTSSINDVAITPDGKKSISGSSDKTCILWDLESGKHLLTLRGHKKKINSVDLSPDGKTALSGSSDNTVILWDIEKGGSEKILTGHISKVNAVAITPDGKLAVSGSSDKTCILWDLENGNPIKTLKTNSEILSVTITPDGKLAASTSLKNTLVWDLDSAKVLKKYSGGNAISVTPDGNLILYSSWDLCKVQDKRSNSKVKKLMGHSSSIRSVSFSVDGEKAFSASNDRTLIQWNVKGGKSLIDINREPLYIKRVSINPDGKSAISVSALNTCIIWNLNTGEALKHFKGYRGHKTAIKIGNNGVLAISAPWDKISFFRKLIFMIYPFENLKELTHSEQALTVTNDGEIAVRPSENNAFTIWDLINKKPIKTIKGIIGRVHSLTVTPEGKLILLASNTNDFFLYDVESEKIVKKFIEHFDTVKAAIISPDCKQVISATENKTVILWDIQSGEKIRTFKGHNGAVTDIVISQDSKFIISTSTDKSCIIWNLQNGLKVAQFFANEELRCISMLNNMLCVGGNFGKTFFLKLPV